MSTSSAASTAWARDSASTKATGSPTKRTKAEASRGRHMSLFIIGSLGGNGQASTSSRSNEDRHHTIGLTSVSDIDRTQTGMGFDGNERSGHGAHPQDRAAPAHR